MPIDAPIHTSAQSIDRVLSAGAPVVLVFWRSDCAPCRQIESALNTLAAEFAGKLLFARIDADSDPELVQRFRITHLPGLVFVQNGQPVANAAGAPPLADLRRWSAHLVDGGARPPVPTGPSEALRPAPKSTAPAADGFDSNGEPMVLTDANFDRVINGDLPVLVDFWAPWCGPCHRIAPAVEALASEFNGRLVVGKLNVDENQRTAGRYGIMSIPTLMIFRGGRVVDQVMGAVPAAMLRQRVLPHVHS